MYIQDTLTINCSVIELKAALDTAFGKMYGLLKKTVIMKAVDSIVDSTEKWDFQHEEGCIEMKISMYIINKQDVQIEIDTAIEGTVMNIFNSGDSMKVIAEAITKEATYRFPMLAMLAA